MSLPKISVQRPVAVLMVFVAIILIGLISLSRLPVELMPNYSFGDISIFVNVRGGMPPQEIETMIAKPIEEAVSDVSFLRDVISISEEGRCRIAMKFEPGINMDYAALEVRERIARIKSELPKESERPVIAKFEQSDMPVLITALAGSGQTPEQLRRFVDEKIKDRIMRVDGVANVDIGGGRERKIIVDIDEVKLAANKIPMQQVVSALGSSNLNLLVGEWEKGGESRYLLRVMGEFDDVESIKNLPVSSSSDYKSAVRLRDIASVKDSYLKAKSFARLNSAQVVSLYIQKESTANTIKVCESVLKAMDKMVVDFKMERSGISFVTTYNQSEGIKRAIKSVKNALVWGGLLAAIVLLFFLRDLRSLCVVTITIPVSVLVTFALMYLYPQGITLNIMTLSGLALGIGMLVDNAVVVLENILRLKAKGETGLKAIVKASDEMQLAIIASTITTVIVFLPIVFVNKEIRILYSGFALTVVFSLIASLAAAITLVPMLYSKISNKAKDDTDFIKKDSVLKKSYKNTLVSIVRHRLLFVALVFILFFISVWVFNVFVPKEFIGTTQQEDFTAFVELPTGAKIGVSDEAVGELESMLKDVPEIKTVSSRVEPWSSKVYVKLKPLRKRKKSTQQVISYLRPKLREIEKKFKDAFIYFEQPQQVESNEVLVEIYGHDYETLSSLAVKMLSAVETIPGLTDLKIRWRKGRPEWQVIVSREKAALFGLTIEDVSQSLHGQMRGLRATAFHTGGKEVEVISRLEEESRDTLGKLKKIPVDLPGGGVIFLEQIAEFEPSIGPGKIWRKNKNRMIQISANRGAYAFGTAVEKMAKVLREVEYPKDYFYRFGENYSRMVNNQRQMRFALFLMLLLIFLVLASLFESYIRPFIIMGTVPLAMIGSVAALIVSGKSVNIGVLMGFILLGGIVVNNAIVMVDHISRIHKKGTKPLNAAIRGACDRLRPVMITSATTILGMMPLALDRSEESALWSPLAITVIGGMLSASILTLFVIPALYMLVEDIKEIISDTRAIS